MATWPNAHSPEFSLVGGVSAPDRPIHEFRLSDCEGAGVNAIREYNKIMGRMPRTWNEDAVEFQEVGGGCYRLGRAVIE